MDKQTAPRRNLILEGLAAGKIVSGLTVQLNSPEIVEMAGRTGFDFAWIDAEHGSFYLDSLVNLLRAADAVGVTPIVRVPDSTPSMIARVLDAGAMGIVVPNLSTKAQTESVVAAARFKSGQSGGTRGACPGTRATWHQTDDWPGFVAWSNRNVLVWGTIENMEGVRNIDDILSVSGLDAIVLGPFDLANDMGYPGQVQHPHVVEALDGAVKKARQRGIQVVASLFSTTPQQIEDEKQHWLSLDVSIFNIGSDRCLVHAAMVERVIAIQSE